MRRALKVRTLLHKHFLTWFGGHGRHRTTFFGTFKLFSFLSPPYEVNWKMMSEFGLDVSEFDLLELLEFWKAVRACTMCSFSGSTFSFRCLPYL